jgi:hypothetical protein
LAPTSEISRLATPVSDDVLDDALDCVLDDALEDDRDELAELALDDDDELDEPPPPQASNSRVLAQTVAYRMNTSSVFRISAPGF